MDKYRLSPEMIKKIHEVLEKGHRIELIPTKDRIKVIREERQEIKTGENKNQE